MPDMRNLLQPNLGATGIGFDPLLHREPPLQHVHLEQRKNTFHLPQANEIFGRPGSLPTRGVTETSLSQPPEIPALTLSQDFRTLAPKALPTPNESKSVDDMELQSALRPPATPHRAPRK
jgi:hypothetical protein